MKRIRIFYNLIIAIVTCVVLSACSHDGDDPQSEPSDLTSRTIIAYVVATNSLNGADEEDIDEMKEAVNSGALGDGGNLLIYRSSYNVAPALLRIDASGEHVVKEYPGSVESLDPDFMSQVITDAMKVAPADDYGLILWSHSTGWRGIESLRQPIARSFGDDNGRVMPIPELAMALNRVPKLAFIYFDSCFMGNVESLYQLRDAADWIMAAPTETPYAGAPYNISLAPLYGSLPAGLTESARLSYEYYMDQISLSMRSFSISVYRTAGLERLAAVTADVLSDSAPLTSVDAIQQYGFPRRYAYFPNAFFDIEDYLSARDTDLQHAADISTAIDGVVVTSYSTPMMWGTYPLDRVCGLSVFAYDELRESGNRYSYTDLDWYEKVYR